MTLLYTSIAVLEIIGILFLLWKIWNGEMYLETKEYWEAWE